MGHIWMLKEKNKIVFGLIALFIIIIFVIPWALTRTWGPECLKFTDTTGSIGDTLGGITAPFIGFLNVILLIWTLLKQIDFNNKQLSVQKNEQFKTVFFQMLQTQRELLHDIQGTFLSRNMKGCQNGGKVTGLEYFHCAYKELETLFNVFDGNNIQNVKEKYQISDDDIKKYNNEKDTIKQIEFVYIKFIDVHIEMKNYFRHLYHILKFISKEKEDAMKNVSGQNEETDIDKWYNDYADMLQATLSEDELVLAYYNCSAYEKARELFLMFKFVENLPQSKLIRNESDVMDGFVIK